MSDVTIVPVGFQKTVVALEDNVSVVVATSPGPKGNDGAGVPEGGVPGQILIKTGDDDFETGWTDQQAPILDRLFVSYPAAVNLSGQRMVRLDSAGELVYAENTDLADAERVLGMTAGAVNTGDTAQVIRSGVVVEPTWNWTLGQPIFLSTTGLLTQTPPAAGFVLQVAFPVSSTSVFIDIKQALIL